MKITFWISLITFCCSLSLFTKFANATNPTAEKHYSDALALFPDRADMNSVDLAISKLGMAESLVTNDDDLKFQILLLSVRLYYWRGLNTEDKEKRLAFFQSAINQAKKIRALNPDIAEGYYYNGIALARWAESKGTESLAKKNEIISLMNDAINHETFEGLLGQEIDGYGPDRTLGRLYYRLPTLAGGSIEKSHKHLKAATSGGGAVALNFVYFSETLMDMGSSSKIEGCKILTDLLGQNPDTYNLDRIPETKREMTLGQTLKNSSCK